MPHPRTTNLGCLLTTARGSHSRYWASQRTGIPYPRWRALERGEAGSRLSLVAATKIAASLDISLGALVDAILLDTGEQSDS